jgi:hypothetical protein
MEWERHLPITRPTYIAERIDVNKQCQMTDIRHNTIISPLN